MKYDVVIVGAGPAGYVAAIRAGQLGLKTALIEKNKLGGMCLNWGCIPSKAIIESGKMFQRAKNAELFGVDGIDKNKLSFNWEKAKNRASKIVKKLGFGVEHLLKKNGVEIIIGEALIHDSKNISVQNRMIECEHIIVATGSYPKKIENNFSDKTIVQVENLLSLEQLPQNIVVYGKGPVAIEMVEFFHMIDKNVSLICPDKNLIPGADLFFTKYIINLFHSWNIPIVYAEVQENYKDGFISVEGTNIKCDILINCSERIAVLPKADFPIELNERNFIQTNENLKTNHKEIYAIGDVNGRAYLAHVASAQGIFVINKIKGIKSSFNIQNYPLNIYTYPEMAQIGKTEQDLIDIKKEYKLSEFPLSSNGKALIENNTDGLIRILSDKKYGQVLGVQIIAEHATDMIAEAAAYMQIEGTVYDVAQTIHAHPTVSEIFMEAGFNAIDKPIHK